MSDLKTPIEQALFNLAPVVDEYLPSVFDYLLDGGRFAEAERVKIAWEILEGVFSSVEREVTSMADEKIGESVVMFGPGENGGEQ